MSRVVLISCVSKKLRHEAKAQDLYQSPLFRMSFKYANSLKPDKILILSAKYHLLSPEDRISPYNITLNKMRSSDIREWAKIVIGELGRVTDLRNDQFIILAGERYRRYIVPYLKSFEVPMEGLGIGKQLQFLRDRLR